VDAVGDGEVLLAVADHLDDAHLQALDALAQHLHLPLLQRDGPLPVRAGERDAGHELGVALEEGRVVGQVLRDVGFGDAGDRATKLRGLGHSSISPR
jgi:hypothetical protein